MVDAIATANVLGQWFAGFLVLLVTAGAGFCIGALLGELRSPSVRVRKRGKR